jgi:hypothetical protein
LEDGEELRRITGENIVRMGDEWNLQNLGLLALFKLQVLQPVRQSFKLSFGFITDSISEQEGEDCRADEDVIFVCVFNS